MVTKIVQKGDPVLRKNAEKVPVKDIPTEKIQTILKQMQEALISQEDGVAIAAPQIGVPLQIFIVSKRAIALTQGEEKATKDIICINPKILKISKEREMMEEGCLSVRDIYGHVERATKVTIEAYDENGKKFTRGSSGLIAQIFQHETDHLVGVLFIDKAQDIYNAKH